MITATTTNDRSDAEEGAGQPDGGSIGLNVTRLWSYLCAVGTVTERPSLASLAREVPRVALMARPPSDDWAVTTLLEIPRTGWAWELPAALEVLEEIAADEELGGPLDERLRTFPDCFGRILADHDSPYMDLAELVMERLGERQQAARAAADAAAGR